MKKFDLGKYLLEYDMQAVPQQETEDDSEMEVGQPEEQQPQIQPQQPQQPQPQMPTATGKKQPISGLQGNVVSDAYFEQLGSNGGKISITVSGNNNPLVISWVGNKIAVTDSDGNQQPLGRKGK